MQTLGATGIRVSELVFVTVEALAAGRALVHCKGKRRAVLLPQKLCRALQGYCRARGITAGPVFVTRTGRPVDRSNLWREMQALCSRAGVEARKVFPHNFRHLVCPGLLRPGQGPGEAGRPAGPRQHRDHAHLYYGERRRA